MQDRSLAGKVALVTGAARRLGAAIARGLHAAGATVWVHYHHSEQDARALQAELNQKRPGSCYLLPADLLDFIHYPALIEQVMTQSGRLDVLVNNASGFYPTPLGEITLQQWHELVGVNMQAPLFLTQAARQALQASQGCIVNMVDIHGLRPLAEHPVYCAAKAGLWMLTQSLARELGPVIRVNGVAPGAILWPEQAMDTDKQAELLARTALERTGTPEAIVRAVLFLVRDADYITGQVLPVDGGRTLNQ